MPRDEVRIRRARADDLPELQRVERDAGARFRGLDLLDHLLDHSLALPELSAHQRAGRIWVAVDRDDRPLGFAVASVLDGAAHLEELDVTPAAGRRGIGTRLVAAVCAWAEGEGFPAITLSTFRDVPWNGPFYVRLGFRPLATSDLSAALRDVRAREERLGIDMTKRVLMRRALRPTPDAPPLRLVLYDGECGLCSGVVRWVSRADRAGLFHFAPLQGATAAALRRRWPGLAIDPESIVYVDRTRGAEEIAQRSDAVFRICALLGGPWRAAAALAWLPRPLTDAAYGVFVRNRHALGGGNAGACALPEGAARGRFLP